MSISDNPRKNTWMFDIKSKMHGHHLNRLCFSGADSEEARDKAEDWAKENFPIQCNVILIEGEISRNENRRAQKEQERNYLFEMKNVLTTKKIKSITPIEES